MFQVIRERYNLNLDAKISDISPLANLTNMGILLLINNQISDISPLVDDTRLGRLYEVRLENNNIDLGEDSEDMENIMILEGREVTVQYE